MPFICQFYTRTREKVHGSLARAGKVRGQTPKVAKQDKKKQPRGRAHKRIQYNRRFVTAVDGFGKKRGPNSSENFIIKTPLQPQQLQNSPNKIPSSRVEKETNPETFSSILIGVCQNFPSSMSATKMLSREEGKDAFSSARTYPNRPVPMRILQVLLFLFVSGLGVCIVSMNMIKYFGAISMVPTRLPFAPCIEESSLESWIRLPSTLMHTMNDTELFWRATFVPQIKSYPYKRVPKVAFMFLTRGPLPLAPLWERYFQGNEGHYSIYVHSLPDYRANFSSSSVFFDRQIPSQVAEWGKMSMCDAERRLLANSMLDFANEWFVLVSEACIPLRNFTIVYRYLARSHYSFMGSYDERGPYGRGRYDKNMVPEVTLAQWRKGSQWFEVTRELAVGIVQDKVYYPKFKAFCQPACYVDEHYFPTMLTIQTPHLLANRTLTWTDWSKGGPHPATFERKDITEKLFKKIFDSYVCSYNHQPVTLCHLFARKFAPSALEPLLAIADTVFGY
ncbi:Glycosyltransferase BC10-like protein [Drosera capensis]